MKTTFSASAVATALFIAISAACSAAVKVEEQVLLPKLGNAQITISPSGGHVAAIMAKGSRVVVVYDGFESQKFDTILNFDGTASPARASGGPTLGGSVLFSPDGSHYAYAAQEGDEFIVMLDGKELARLPYGEPKPRINPFAFSTVGNHFYFGVMSGNTSDPKEGFRMFVDGKPGPTSRSFTETNSANTNGILFNPDGTRYAYIGTSTRDLPEGKWAVANGKQVKYFGGDLRFTATGRLLSVVTTPGVFGTPPTPGSQTLLIDTKPVLKALYITEPVWVSPSGDTYAVAITPREGAPSFLTLNGKPVPGTENTQVGGVYFSPDGKRLAALCTPAGATSGRFMILDGKKSPKYQSIDYSPPNEPVFSPDSSKFVYVGNNNGRFLVVNGEESDAGFSLGPYFGAGGSRLAYALQLTGGHELHVDDKVVFNGVLDDFRFSADGAHYAFVGNKLLHLDGAPLSNFAVGEWTGIVATGMFTGQVERYHYVFSPDGKHLAYLGDDPNNEKHRGLWIDKTFLFHSPSNYSGSILRPTFTPDSQHLFWYDRVAPSVSEPQGHFQLYVDGESSLTFPPTFFSYDRGSSQGTAWEVGPDNALQILVVANGSLKRYRITPSPDKTIETLMVAAK
ncbi:MAG: WD40 repeat domain-containing protein [Opitutus sp.]